MIPGQPPVPIVGIKWTETVSKSSPLVTEEHETGKPCLVVEQPDGSAARLATLPGAGAVDHVCAVAVFLRSVDSLALVSQAEGVSLGGSH
jgi:hypothetical protein